MTIREISNTRNSNDRNNLRSDGQGSGVLQDQGRGREDVLCTQGSVCGPVADEDGRKGDVQPETIPSSDGCGSDPLAVLNSLPGEQVEQLVRATPIRHTPRVVVGSPAYQMPEIPSEAQKWAEKYRRDHALEHWVVDHLSAAYYAGHSAGFSDCATGVEVIVKSMGAK